MKKILGFVAALLLALSLPMTVFAESKDAPDSNQGYKILLRDKADPNGVKVGDNSAAVRAAWKISADVLPDGYKVSAVKDAYVVQGKTEVDPATVSPAYSEKIKAAAGTNIVLHYGKNGVEKFTGEEFTLSTDNMSPVIFLVKDDTKTDTMPSTTPSKTSDGKKATNTADSSNMFVYGGLLVVALGAIAAVVTAKKRNA